MLKARIRELYREGGVSELFRGIRDFALIRTPLPVHLLYRNVTLSIDGVNVILRVRDSESAYWTIQRGSGHGETDVMRDFVREVTPDDHVWDIGANIGSYTLLAAVSGASVTAFEPGADARANLLANADANGVRNRVDATPYALSDWTGQGVLLPAKRSGIRELRRDADHGDTVPVARGDSLSLTPPTVAKIDVEGAEVSVLEGLGDLLSGCRAVYVEVHEGVNRAAVVDILNQAELEVVDEWDEILKAVVIQ